MKQRLIQVGVILVLIACVMGYMLVNKVEEKYEPTQERMDLYTYYGLKEGAGDIIVYLNHEKMSGFEDVAIISDGKIYILKDMVSEYFNSRYYYDASVKLLLYTTATQIYKYELNSFNYTVNGESMISEYPVVITREDMVYIALDHVTACSDVRYEFFENPGRLLLVNEWKDVEYIAIQKDGAIRKLAGPKSPVVVDAKAGEEYIYIDELDNYVCVQSESGIKGYIDKDCVGKKSVKTLKSTYTEPVYTNITRDYKINLAWHQVTNQTANDNLDKVMQGVTGVNVISPTWFRMCDNDGNISSLAEKSYVDKAHAMGLEVWALVENITYSGQISTYSILSKMESRERLVASLIAEVLKYGIDGINVDIESLSFDAAEGYIQFLRELSIECRKHKIVLSIDNYVPSASTFHYNRSEQGIIADYVIIMGYDEHYGGDDESGSTASIGWVEEGIVNTLKTVPAKKVINALPFYTRVWKQTPETAVSGAAAGGVLVEDKASEYGRYLLTSEAVSMAYAENLLKKNNVTPVWNEVLGQYYGEYVSNGCTYQIWLEEERSVVLKMALVKEYDLAGVAGWKLSLQKNTVWDIISSYLE